MNGLYKLTGLSAVVCMGFVPSGRADVVSDWNLFAVLAINAAGRPAGGSPFLDTATVHLAMHDAVAAIDRQFQPYHVTITGASGSLVAAAAAAAHDVLVNRFPAQAASLDSTYADYLATHGLSQKDP